jgi:hypothetical protein
LKTNKKYKISHFINIKITFLNFFPHLRRQKKEFVCCENENAESNGGNKTLWFIELSVGKWHGFVSSFYERWIIGKKCIVGKSFKKFAKKIFQVKKIFLKKKRNVKIIKKYTKI